MNPSTGSQLLKDDHLEPPALLSLAVSLRTETLNSPHMLPTLFRLGQAVAGGGENCRLLLNEFGRWLMQEDAMGHPAMKARIALSYALEQASQIIQPLLVEVLRIWSQDQTAPQRAQAARELLTAHHSLPKAGMPLSKALQSNDWELCFGAWQQLLRDTSEMVKVNPTVLADKIQPVVQDSYTIQGKLAEKLYQMTPVEHAYRQAVDEAVSMVLQLYARWFPEQIIDSVLSYLPRLTEAGSSAEAEALARVLRLLDQGVGPACPDFDVRLLRRLGSGERQEDLAILYLYKIRGVTALEAIAGHLDTARQHYDDGELLDPYFSKDCVNAGKVGAFLEAEQLDRLLRAKQQGGILSAGVLFVVAYAYLEQMQSSTTPEWTARFEALARLLTVPPVREWLQKTQRDGDADATQLADFLLRNGSSLES